jgi:hypothetical protein
MKFHQIATPKKDLMSGNIQNPYIVLANFSQEDSKMKLDPNEAIKEVLKQILDSENKRHHNNIYG